MNNICTTLEQSKKLIELGIDVNTADMSYPSIHNVGQEVSYCNVPLAVYPIGDCIPAWSLSALLELIPPYLGEFNEGIDFGLSKSMNDKWYSAHYMQLNDDGLYNFTKIVTGNTAIDAVFEIICWLKKEKI